MIGFSDTSYSSTLHPTGSPQKAASPLLEHRITVPPERKSSTIQLTPLWEHVVRTRSVPKDANLDEIFQALNDRLHDPEWEVRQNALRVLVDVIPVIGENLDQKMEILLGDLVGNLGHPGPAVRKGALDSLKVYLEHSTHSEDILRNIVFRGVEKHSEFQLSTDVVVGIILSLPCLIFPNTSDKLVQYIITTLVNKLVQITYQESAVRSLSRIQELIGTSHFNSILNSLNSRKDFESLCLVYDTNNKKSNFNDLNANVIDNRWNSDSDDNLKQNNINSSNNNQENNLQPSGKVILETEIQFNSSTAVTMKILEEGQAGENQDSDSEDDNDCVVKVLTDSEPEETFELRRRTPRRVRFGGEIVKLRTPDSDSNHHSDLDSDITITTSKKDNSPVIEIKFITDEGKKSKHSSRSLIPVPINPTTHKPKISRSLPSSPNRRGSELIGSKKLLYQSHPNLTRSHFFNNKQTSTKSVSSAKLKVQIPKRNSASPVLLHREIELFHNLTRSPVDDTPPTFNSLPPQINNNKEDIKIPDQFQQTKSTDTSNPKKEIVPLFSNNEQSFTMTDLSDNDSTPGRTYSSFILKDSASEGIQSDSCIPNNDSGDCLTCSSSGSEGVQFESNWESSGIFHKTIIDALHNKDDLRTKIRGFEMLGAELRKPEILQRIQPHLNSILHFLFNAERHPRLQELTEVILLNIFRNIPTENLKQCLPQLSMSISKIGAPSGIRLGIVLMQKISARTFIQYVLEEPIMSSRSAKTREGAMQLLISATSTFPSTEFDVSSIAERVALVATDRKRRVRQVTLDVLANLAQIGQPGVVLESVAKAAKDLPDRDGLLAAVRARLTRRQLPLVEPDGTIITASPGVGHGADVEWVAAGSGSMSPCSARARRRVMTPGSMTQQKNIRNDSAIVPSRNMWSARSYPENVDGFGSNFDNQENMAWTLVPVNNVNKEDSQNKIFPASQVWAIDQAPVNGENRFTTSSGSLRPIYLLQSQKPSSSIRLQQIPTNNNNNNITSNGFSQHGSTEFSNRNNNNDRRTSMYSRGRSSSPVMRLVQLNGTTRTMRGQSSSPPEFNNRRGMDLKINRKAFATDASSDSSQSIKSSPPRSNWRRDFQSAIPVPVSGEGSRTRFRRRHRDGDHERLDGMSVQQPMIALPYYYQSNLQQNGGENAITNGQTKSPSPTLLSVDKFNISQDSGINHQTSSSNSESSDYYTPPAEPYLPLQQDSTLSNRNQQNDAYIQSDRSNSPLQEPQQRERFINLDNPEQESTSDFEEHDEKKGDNDDSHDETDFIRTQIYQKLQEEHHIRDMEFDNRISEKRLSKSHADLSEVKKFTRKTINSAPLVKHLKEIERFQQSNNPNSILPEESHRSSQNSLSQSHADLRSLTQSQTDLKSLTNSQGNISQNSNLFRSQTDLRSISLSQTNLELQSLNDSQINLNTKEPEIFEIPAPVNITSQTIKYPEIHRKKSVSKIQTRSSNIPTKIPSIFPDTLRSYPKPREGLSEVVSNLESPEWERSVQGLQGLVRLVRHHQEVVEAQLHNVCVLLGRHIKNLRSQVARAACSAAREMFNNHMKSLDQELEELVVPLLQRTADTNKFLRSDANTALDAMCMNVNPAKSVLILSTRGATHHNAVVRCATTRLLVELVHRLGPNKIFQLSKDIRDRIFTVGANMLMEGSLETRKHSKSMFLELSNHPHFQRAVAESIAPSTMRHISKILNNLK